MLGSAKVQGDRKALPLKALSKAMHLARRAGRNSSSVQKSPFPNEISGNGLLAAKKQRVQRSCQLLASELTETPSMTFCASDSSLRTMSRMT